MYRHEHILCVPHHHVPRTLLLGIFFFAHSSLTIISTRKNKKDYTMKRKMKWKTLKKNDECSPSRATSNCFCIIFYYAVLYLIIPPFYLVYIVFYIVSCPFILFIVFLFFLLSTMVKKNEGAKLSLFYYTRIILHLITSFQIMLLYFGHQSVLLHLLSFTIECVLFL